MRQSPRAGPPAPAPHENPGGPGVLGPRTRLGRYYIVRHIKTGGMGAVYRAEDPETGQVVAIKTMVADASIKSEAYARFLGEAKAACSIRHRNVIQIHGFDVHQGMPYLVMEYLWGEPLNELIQRGPLSIERAADIIGAVCSAMVAVHGHHILHRDLKPSNIYLADSDEGELIKVLDFGVSKLRTATDLKMTDSHTIVGSIRYMSPEQARGVEVDERSDQFSIGVVLYECLTGCRPHEGQSVFEISDSIIHGRFRLPREHRTEIAVELQNVLLRALSLDPADRYPSVSDLGTAVLAFASEEAKRRLTDLLSGQPSRMQRGQISARLPVEWFQSRDADAVGLQRGDSDGGESDGKHGDAPSDGSPTPEERLNLTRGLAPTEPRRAHVDTAGRPPDPGRERDPEAARELPVTASISDLMIAGPAANGARRLRPTVTSPVIVLDIEGQPFPAQSPPKPPAPSGTELSDDVRLGRDADLTANGASTIRSPWRAAGLVCGVLLGGALIGIGWLELFPARRRSAADSSPSSVDVPAVSKAPPPPPAPGATTTPAPAASAAAPATAAAGPTAISAPEHHRSSGSAPAPAPIPTLDPNPAAQPGERPMNRRLIARRRHPRNPPESVPVEPTRTNNGVLILE